MLNLLAAFAECPDHIFFQDAKAYFPHFQNLDLSCLLFDQVQLDSHEEI